MGREIVIKLRSGVLERVIYYVLIIALATYILVGPKSPFCTDECQTLEQPEELITGAAVQEIEELVEEEPEEIEVIEVEDEEPELSGIVALKVTKLMGEEDDDQDDFAHITGYVVTIDNGLDEDFWPELRFFMWDKEQDDWTLFKNDFYKTPELDLDKIRSGQVKTEIVDINYGFRDIENRKYYRIELWDMMREELLDSYADSFFLSNID